MQTRISIILIVLFFSSSAIAQESVKLKTADSLFRAKQFTQSFAIYDSIFAKRSYSSAMLLKMAFIQEGLNHPGRCLYYLNLYQKASDDQQAAAKMEELAQKYRLEGYRPSEASGIYHFFEKYRSSIALLFGALVFVSFALAIYQKRKGVSVKVPIALVVVFACCLVANINWGDAPTMGIVLQSKTYLMGGPSAGAAVVDVLEEGHRLTIVGKKDVWLHVKWRERDAFVKETNLLPIVL